MKAARHKKVLGLAIGERSLLVAEVIAGEPPRVRKLGEMPYPAGITAERIAELGPALSHFLRENDFSSRAAVVGIPARWLVVKPKEVPSTDPASLAPMLRLQAEVEFSSELKDLVYDFAGGSSPSDHTVLLVATTRKHMDAVEAMCESARVEALVVTPSAVALGEATGRILAKDALVLSVGAGGSELTAQRGTAPGAIRSLSAAASKPPFSDLRRALTSMGSAVRNRELFLWNGAELDADALGTSLGFTVRSGDLPLLGLEVDEDSLATPLNGAYAGRMLAGSAASNGQGRQYASAVALALGAVGMHRPTLDFLHSRLAAPKEQRVPLWAVLAAAAGLLLLMLGVWGYIDLHARQKALKAQEHRLETMKGDIDQATAFVKKVSFAQQFHGGDVRYLACLRDLSQALPDDGDTYVTSVVIDQPVSKPAPGANPAKIVPPRRLTGRIVGKTIDQSKQKLVQIQVAMGQHRFTDVKLLNSNQAPSNREWTFSISFSYEPPKSAP